MNGHENDANGANSSADNGAANGGIFSTPDLTIETQNIPANVGGAPVIDETATPADSNSSRIASAFANTDATAQSQDVALAMQNRSNSTSSTATGDIKLTPSAKPKSKAPLIIVALLVLVGVGALVWAAATGKLGFGGGASDETETVTLAEVQKAYNQYATYVLFGESKDVLEGEWKAGQIYKVSEILNSSSDATEYWENSIRLINSAIEKYKQLPDIKKRLLDKIENQKQYLVFFRLAQVNDDFSETMITNYFLKNGYSESLEYIKSINTQLEGLLDTSFASTIREVQDTLPIMQTLVEQLSNFGCNAETFTDESCIDSLSDEQYSVYADILDQIEAREYTLIGKMRVLSRDMTSACWSIKTQISNSEEYTEDDNGESE